VADGFLKHVVRWFTTRVPGIDPLVNELVERLRAEQSGQHRTKLGRTRRNKLFTVERHLAIFLLTYCNVVVTCQSSTSANENVCFTHNTTVPPPPAPPPPPPITTFGFYLTSLFPGLFQVRTEACLALFFTRILVLRL